MKKYELDATNRKLGRIASQAAVLIMGKNSPDYARNKMPDVTVIINNASKADINEKKKSQTEHRHYTGYPGGLRMKTMAQIIEKKGYSELFKKAVFGMLPSNKLRSRMIKKLIVNE